MPDTPEAAQARAEQYAKFIETQQKSDPGSVFRLNDSSVADVEVIPTGAVALDVALGVGGLPRGRIVELFGPEMSGKCLVAGTYMWTDHGLETIEELFARCGQKASATTRVTDITSMYVRAVNEDGELERVEALTHNYIKRTIRVTLASGRTVEATTNHPLRVLDEAGNIVWKQVGQMAEGDVVVSAAFGADEAHGASGLSEDEAVLLGYLVAEGTMGQAASTGFTNFDQEVADEFRSLAESVLGAEVKSWKDGNYWINSKAVRDRLEDEYGMERHNAAGKVVPYRVRTAGPKVQRAFLSALYEGDGWVEDGPSVGLTVASEELARQVQLMLLGLGVPTTFTTKFNKEYQRNYFSVLVAPGAVHRFLDVVGFRTSRRAAQVATHLKDTCGYTNHENIPNLEPLVRALRDAVGGDRSFDALYGDLRRDGHTDCSRGRLRDIVEWAGGKHLNGTARRILATLEELASSRYTFERIVKIEDAGEQPTFDVVLPRTHSFLANGIVSHNTSLALATCAMAQKMGGFVGVIDAEHAFSRDFAVNAFGIDPDRLAIAQPDDGVTALRMVERMCESGAFDVIVVDSVAALLPPAMAENEIGEANQLGQHAKMMSDGLRKLTPIVANSRAVVIFVNQIRMNPGAYGNPETTTGGKALPFYASVRIEVRSPASKRITQGSQAIGQTCNIKIKKNKVAPPHREASYELYYDSGIAFEASLIEAAEQVGVITRAGASYTEVATGERIGVGREQVKLALQTDEELRDRLTRATYAAAGVSLPEEG